MKPEVNLYVFVVLDDGRILRAGRLLSRNLFLAQKGGYEGFFRYDPDYLATAGCYPLDPLHLPLGAQVFRAMRPECGIHGVFEDSLPNSWGERLLARKAGLHTSHYAPAHLLQNLGRSGLGALLYAADEICPPAAEDLSLDFAVLAPALEEAARYEKTLEPVELKYLISSGYSAGGARPKMLVKKGAEHFIAKFSSIHDRGQSINVRLEAAGLTLAKRAGLEVPDFQIAMVRKRPVLLVKRFDITEQYGRQSLISFRTLLACFDDPGRISYGDLAEVLRRVSSGPQEDLTRLFKQMVLNILIINTDDHLQNFSMLHSRHGWRLSPAYDLVPNLRRDEQLLLVNGNNCGLTIDDAIHEGKRFGFTKTKSLTLIEQIFEGLRGWPELITDVHMTKRIEQRLHEFYTR